MPYSIRHINHFVDKIRDRSINFYNYMIKLCILIYMHIGQFARD